MLSTLIFAIKTKPILESSILYICDRHDASNITSCAIIIPEESSNNSDHLHVQLKFSLAIKELNPKKYCPDKHNNGVIKPIWKNDNRVENLLRHSLG